jgi:hypothetical protein
MDSPPSPPPPLKAQANYPLRVTALLLQLASLRAAIALL